MTITKKQKQILDFVKTYSQKHGYSPSIPEMAKHFKLAVSTVHEHLQKLEEAGKIKLNKNKHRGIEILQSISMINVPIRGTIAAGQPIEVIETEMVDATVSVAEHELGRHGDYYALRVQGNSMIDDGIFDGDIVVIRKQETAEDGQTVVAIIDDNEATLKRIYHDKGRRIRLQPANQTLLPLYRTEVEIRGIVVKIIRELESMRDQDSELIKLIKSMPPTTNAHRTATSKQCGIAKPFIQWVGGKREMISQYKEFIPNKFNSYYEPFLGGGAMFFHLQPDKAILSDNNTELIKTYEGVRDSVEEVIKILKDLKSKHSEDLYNKIRNFDREMNISHKLNNAETAARMIYLNQTCFNGLYRVNQNGQFNVPIGSSLNRLICDEHTLRKASKVLKGVDIEKADFNTSTRNANKGDFVYFDPPYYPVSIYSDFTRYTKEKFHKEDQIRLKNEIDRLNKLGCKVMLSNSDCEFIRDLYKDYHLHKVYSGRSLNSKKDRRGKISELLITNY